MLTRLIIQLSVAIWLILGAISLLVHATAKQQSPENQVVYVASLLSKRQLYTADLNREISWRLYRSDNHNEVPTVNPITRDIVFVSDMDGDTELFFLSANGHTLKQLTDNDHNDNFPQWSPDGTQILYEANPDNVSQFFLMSIDNLSIQALTQNNVAFSRPSWSPDGTQITYDSVGDIHIYDIATQTSEPITDSNFWLQRPMWSSDGSRIAYEVQRGRNTTLSEVELTTGEEFPLSTGDRADRHITWTNDPNQIVFQFTRLFPGRLYSLMVDQPTQISEIAIPPLSGSPLYLLFGQRDVLEPDWTDILQPAWVR